MIENKINKENNYEKLKNVWDIWFPLGKVYEKYFVKFLRTISTFTDQSGLSLSTVSQELFIWES